MLASLAGKKFVLSENSQGFREMLFQTLTQARDDLF
jgi:hypothetical protein